MKVGPFLGVVVASCLAGGSAGAEELTITITNLTQGMSFTPRLVVAHTDAIDLFEPGEPAIRPLALVAEGGVITSTLTTDDFADYLNDMDRDDENSWQAFGGLLPPATTSSPYTFETDDHPLLSIVTMLIPTNDAFAGLDSWRIPTTPGTYRVTLNAYDAGTEANDEINATRTDVTEVGGLPLGGVDVPGMAGSGNPNATDVGVGGTGVAIQIINGMLADDAADREGVVHIHRNVLGDTNPNGGISDLDSRVHRWLNPVARVTVIVR